MKELIHHNDTCYVVLRKIRVHNFLTKTGDVMKEKLNDWRLELHADHILRSQDHFIFVETVTDATEIIDEDTPTDLIPDEFIDGNGY